MNEPEPTLGERAAAIRELFFGHANLDMGREEVEALLRYIDQLQEQLDSCNQFVSDYVP